MPATLSAPQKARLKRDGYVVVRGLVPRPLVDEALREINHGLGTRTGSYSVETDWLSEHVSSPAAMNLLRLSPAAALVQSLLGEVEPCSQAQIALRFPARPGDAPAPPDAHIDGLSPDRAIERFSMLVGVLLSDAPGKSMGNLAVYPGTHLSVARRVREHGLEAARAGLIAKLRLPAPVQITGKAGDAVICHHQLAHGKMKNFSHEIRSMAYFRIYHRDAWRDRTETYVKRALTDPWMEWPAMRGIRGT